MTSKEKEEIKNREKDLKKKSNKRKKEKLRKAQAVSRKHRSKIRNELKPYNTFQDLDKKSLLFIMADTNNMESVLLQKKYIDDNRVLLTLPWLTKEMIINYLDTQVLNGSTTQLISEIDEQTIKDIISYYYSITVDEIIDCEYGKMYVIKKFEINEINPNMISVNVRPYNLMTWYDNEFSSISGTRIYKGKRLKTFFNIGIDVTNLFVLQDTILKLLLYKAMMNKINPQNLRLDVKCLAQKGGYYRHIYEIVAVDFGQLYNRFDNECEENTELNKLKRVRNSNTKKQ